MARQAEATEASLWEALRALEEQAALFRHLADGAFAKHSVVGFLRRAEEKDKAAALVRELLIRSAIPADDQQKAE